MNFMIKYKNNKTVKINCAYKYTTHLKIILFNRLDLCIWKSSIIFYFIFFLSFYLSICFYFHHSYYFSFHHSYYFSLYPSYYFSFSSFLLFIVSSFLQFFLSSFLLFFLFILLSIFFFILLTCPSLTSRTRFCNFKQNSSSRSGRFISALCPYKSYGCKYVESEFSCVWY